MPEIDMDELGRWWVFSDTGQPYAGPYDTAEEAAEAHPEAA
jgi:hypothetical protein